MKKALYYVGSYIRMTDKLLWALCLVSSAFGILILVSMSYHFYTDFSYRMVAVQIGALAMGMILAIFLSNIDYRVMAELWKYHAVFCWLLVLGTFVFGYQRPGTDDRAWYYIFGLMFQPAELAKISFILTFSLHLEWLDDKINQIKFLIPLLLHAAIPILIVHFQGDDGTALVFAAIFLCMIIAAGISIKYLMAAFGALLVSAPFIWFYLMSEGKKLRFLTLLNPELDPLGGGWQQVQGKISIGSGMIWGKGLFGALPRKLPEMQNDFIFAYIGETTGFVGSIIVIAVLFWICIKILNNARLSKDKLGTYICVGYFGLLAFQILLNIGMCLSITPVVGLTLPFFSSGGSSMVTLFCGIGVVMSVYMHNRPMLFSDN